MQSTPGLQDGTIDVGAPTAAARSLLPVAAAMVAALGSVVAGLLTVAPV